MCSRPGRQTWLRRAVNHTAAELQAKRCQKQRAEATGGVDARRRLTVTTVTRDLSKGAWKSFNRVISDSLLHKGCVVIMLYYWTDR